MERNAHYAAVGLATLLLFAGLVLFAIWLAHFQFRKEYDNYDVIFTGAVRGLSEGGEVQFNGIKVGEVTSLKLDKHNPNHVVARTRLTSDVPVKVDSRAQLEPQGITGVSYIQLTAGGAKSPLLKSQYPPDAVPVIQSQLGPLSELLEGGGSVLARAIDVLDRVNRVLSDENIKSASNTLGHIESVSAELDARKDMLAKADVALGNAGQAAAEIRDLAHSTRGVVDGDGKDAIKKVDAAAGEIDSTVKDIHAMVLKLQGPTTNFASNGLPQLTQAVSSLQEAAESLTRLVDEAQRNPRGLIAKAPAKEVEVQP